MDSSVLFTVVRAEMKISARSTDMDSDGAVRSLKYRFAEEKF